MPLQVPGAVQQQPGYMMDAVTPLGPAARAAREQNNAEARIERWDAAVLLLVEDSNESLVRKHPALSCDTYPWLACTAHVDCSSRTPMHRGVCRY